METKTKENKYMIHIKQNNVVKVSSRANLPTSDANFLSLLKLESTLNKKEKNPQIKLLPDSKAKIEKKVDRDEENYIDFKKGYARCREQMKNHERVKFIEETMELIPIPPNLLYEGKQNSTYLDWNKETLKLRSEIALYKHQHEVPNTWTFNELGRVVLMSTFPMTDIDLKQTNQLEISLFRFYTNAIDIITYISRYVRNLLANSEWTILPPLKIRDSRYLSIRHPTYMTWKEYVYDVEKTLNSRKLMTTVDDEE